VAAAPALPQAGIGLRQPHYQALMQDWPPLGFVEVHSENFFGDGGAALAVLDAVRAQYPVSLHGVGLSLGSACGLDPVHLDRLASLVSRVEPVRVSDHACFSRGALVGEMVHAGDLLPIAFTPASLDILVRNVDAVQSRLRRPILVENLSASMHYVDDCMTEPEFLTALCRRSGCQLLLDLNNLVVNGLNAVRRLQADCTDLGTATEQALAFLHALPPDLVGEIHLAGFRLPTRPGQNAVDDHSTAVPPEVWQVHAAALRHFGHQPTLIEWDTDLPSLAVLLDQARQADAMASQTLTNRAGAQP
jgi:uncharacterized protein (UPF0276 family)